jgi:hypothetical protein
MRVRGLRPLCSGRCKQGARTRARETWETCKFKMAVRSHEQKTFIIQAFSSAFCEQHHHLEAWITCAALGKWRVKCRQSHWGSSTNLFGRSLDRRRATCCVSMTSRHACPRVNEGSDTSTSAAQSSFHIKFRIRRAPLQSSCTKITCQRPSLTCFRVIVTDVPELRLRYALHTLYNTAPHLPQHSAVASDANFLMTAARVLEVQRCCATLTAAASCARKVVTRVPKVELCFA